MGSSIVVLMGAEISSLVREGLPVAKRIGAQVTRRAVKRFRQGEDWIDDVSIESLYLLLVKLMFVARLTGMKRSMLLRSIVAARRPYVARERALKTFLNLDSVLMQSILEFSEKEVKSMSVALSNKIKSKLTSVAIDIQVEGLHVKAGMGRIRKAFNSLGITPANSYTLENLMRTQTQLAHAAGRFYVDQDPAVSEFLWGYTYATAGDARVRLNHAALDGVTLPKDDPQWDRIFPPNGYSCRCQAIPIFEERAVQRPRDVVIDGAVTKPGPDKGWDFHPGKRGISGTRTN